MRTFACHNAVVDGCGSLNYRESLLLSLSPSRGRKQRLALLPKNHATLHHPNPSQTEASHQLENCWAVEKFRILNRHVNLTSEEAFWR